MFISGVDFLATKEHPRCTFGFGESIGASQLLQSLDPRIPFCAVAVESPFATFREIAMTEWVSLSIWGRGWGESCLRPMVEGAFLRARWRYGLDMERVSPEESVAASTIPVLLIHGQIDSNIPVRHSRLIHARAPQAQLWEVPGADHCGAESTAPQEFDKRLLRWFQPRSSLSVKNK